MTVLPRPYPQQMRNLFVRMGDEYAQARGEPSDPAARRLRQRYRLAGAEEHLGHFLSYDGHAYNREMREAVYAWFDRWLMGRTNDGATGRSGEGAMAEEGEPEADPATTLAVFGGPAPGTGMLDLYRAIAERRAQSTDPGTTRRDRLDQVLVGPVSAPEGGVAGGWPARTPLRAHVVGEERVEIGDVAADRTRVYLFSEPDVVVPMLFLRPTGSAVRDQGTRARHRSEGAGGAPRPLRNGEGAGPAAWQGDLAIHFSLGGKEAVPEAAITADLAAGRAVLLPDVRGTGETKQERRTPDAWLSSVVLGRPIHGMRAWDLRRAADWLYGHWQPGADRPLATAVTGDNDTRASSGNVTTPPAHDDDSRSPSGNVTTPSASYATGNVTTLALRAHGDAGAGIVALLAAATDRRFASLEVEELLLSFRSQPDFGPNRDWVIPRILDAGDIDDLLAMVAPRPVTVHRWVRADGERLEVP